MVSGLAQESVNAMWFFRKNGEHVCRFRSLVAIAWRLYPFVHAADEATFFERSLTIVKRGMVFHHRRLLTRGPTFGDDMLLNALDGVCDVVERVNETCG